MAEHYVAKITIKMTDIVAIKRQDIEALGGMEGAKSLILEGIEVMLEEYNAHEDFIVDIDVKLVAVGEDA